MADMQIEELNVGGLRRKPAVTGYRSGFVNFALPDLEQKHLDESKAKSEKLVAMSPEAQREYDSLIEELLSLEEDNRKLSSLTQDQRTRKMQNHALMADFNDQEAGYDSGAATGLASSARQDFINREANIAAELNATVDAHTTALQNARAAEDMAAYYADRNRGNNPAEAQRYKNEAEKERKLAERLEKQMGAAREFYNKTSGPNRYNFIRDLQESVPRETLDLPKGEPALAQTTQPAPKPSTKRMSEPDVIKTLLKQNGVSGNTEQGIIDFMEANGYSREEAQRRAPGVLQAIEKRDQKRVERNTIAAENARLNKQINRLVDAYENPGTNAEVLRSMQRVVQEEAKLFGPNDFVTRTLSSVVGDIVSDDMVEQFFNNSLDKLKAARKPLPGE
jgi:hypothetical protein